MAKEVFLRQSSGLVRDVSPWPSMLANWALITGGTPLLIISWLWLAPGANWALAYLITLIPTLGMAFLYYVAAASMPRAGADTCLIVEQSTLLSVLQIIGAKFLTSYSYLYYKIRNVLLLSH